LHQLDLPILGFGALSLFLRCAAICENCPYKKSCNAYQETFGPNAEPNRLADPNRLLKLKKEIVG
jgi:hypothetical protein